VQWMTAASGLVHEEFHSPAYSQRGGQFEVIQLWVNLAAKDKKAEPSYQSISNTDIPRVELPSGDGFVRVIAGEYQGRRGPARSFSPMNVWGSPPEGRRPRGISCASWLDHGALRAQGRVRLRSGEIVGAAELAVFEREKEEVAIEVLEDTTICS